MPQWDPELYRRFADHRDRPFYDLVGRVAADSPRQVVDLGCGPATLTVTLTDRWPEAHVTGVDSSPDMIRTARENVGDRVDLVEADLRAYVAQAADASIDVIVSNAAMQWVPDHLDLLPDLVRTLSPGGWLAIQVPGNHNAPLHSILRELAAEEPYAAHTADATRLVVTEPRDYLDRLSDLGCVVDAWETTYSQVLQGEDAVFTWISGTGARPILQALPADLRERFEVAFRSRLRDAYPQREYGTVLPFRRVFAVAHRVDG